MVQAEVNLKRIFKAMVISAWRDASDGGVGLPNIEVCVEAAKMEGLSEDEAWSITLALHNEVCKKDPFFCICNEIEAMEAMEWFEGMLDNDENFKNEILQAYERNIQDYAYTGHSKRRKIGRRI